MADTHNRFTAVHMISC